MLLTIHLGIVTFTYLNEEATKTLPMIIYIFILNIFIYVTDILDGRLARQWNVCSKSGELLDVLADLGYMTSQYCILIKTGFMPFIILNCIYLEFLVFVKTSLYYKPFTRRNLFFNKIGKLVAAYYYLLPILYIGAIYLKCKPLIFMIINIVCIILTSAAIWDRISIGLYFFKIQKQT